MTDFYPDVKVYLDVSGNPLSATATWTDVTEFVCHEPIQTTYGRSRGGDDPQPGSGALSLINIDGRFDPDNASGTYYGAFGLRTRIMIEATVYGDGSGSFVGGGFVTSIRQRWNHRAEQIADITWTDLLGVLATYELPESAWDHVIGNRSGVFAWHKLGSDTTSTVRDYSGNGRHGTWRTYEGTDTFYSGARTPDVIVQAGVSDSVIPQVDRPSQSWGKMIAEAGQPLRGISSGSTPAQNWRASSVVCDQSTAALMEPGQNWSLEMWTTIRAAWALNVYSTPIYLIDSSPFQWGDTAYWDGSTAPGPNGPMWRLVFSRSLDAGVSWYDTASSGPLTRVVTTGTPYSTGAYNTASPDPVHVVFTLSGSTLTVYLNGEAINPTVNVASIPRARGFPLVIGPSCGFGSAFSIAQWHSWWGTTGDVVIYDRAITAAEVLEGYVAGRWGRTDSVASALLPGEAVRQAAAIVNVDIDCGSSQVQDGSHPIVPGPFARRNALDYMRLCAASEGGWLFGYVDFVGMWDANWPTRTDSTTTQFLLSDDNTVDSGANYASIGHTGTTYVLDDRAVANDVTVTWRGGDVRAENPTSIARYGRLRSSFQTVLARADHATSKAEFEVWRRGSPTGWIDSVSVEPAGTEEDWWVIYVEIGYRFRVITTRPDGSKIDQPCIVESISHQIDMGRGTWRTTFGLAPADWPAAPFLIGTSELGGADVAWY